jgi:hypothetical protein
MAYTFLDLKTKLTTQIGDPNLDSTVMGDALNYTQQAIFGAFDLTLNSATQTNSIITGANTLVSALPTDLQRIMSLYVSSPIALANDLTDYFLKVKDFRTLYPHAGFYVGPIKEWTYFTSIEFAMSSSADLTVQIDYIKTTPLLSAASDVPVIPETYEELLILGAKKRVYEQKEDFDYASQFSNTYADLLEAFTTRYSTRQVDNQVVIAGARSRV